MQPNRRGPRRIAGRRPRGRPRAYSDVELLALERAFRAELGKMRARQSPSRASDRSRATWLAARLELELASRRIVDAEGLSRWSKEASAALSALQGSATGGRLPKGYTRALYLNAYLGLLVAQSKAAGRLVASPKEIQIDEIAAMRRVLDRRPLIRHDPPSFATDPAVQTRADELRKGDRSDAEVEDILDAEAQRVLWNLADLERRRKKAKGD